MRRRRDWKRGAWVDFPGCAWRGWPGRGLGRHLMQETLRLLAAKGSEGVSLTVTAENHSVVPLYRDLDFHVTKGFTAYARNLPAPEASSIPTAGVEFAFLISSFDSSSAVSGSSGISLQLFQQGLEARMAAQ